MWNVKYGILEKLVVDKGGDGAALDELLTSAYHKGVESVCSIRCIEHFKIPTYCLPLGLNTIRSSEHRVPECGACLVETVRAAIEEAIRRLKDDEAVTDMAAASCADCGVEMGWPAHESQDGARCTICLLRSALEALP